MPRPKIPIEEQLRREIAQIDATILQLIETRTRFANALRELGQDVPEAPVTATTPRKRR